jgi:hypothetical protein
MRIQTWEELFGPKFPGWPLHRVVFNPVPDTYPMSEVEVWQQLQEAVNWTVSKLVSFVSQGNQRWALDATKLKDPKSAKAKLTSGNAVEIIEVKDTNNAGEAMQSVQGAPVSQDTYRLIDILMGFIERTSLQGQNQQLQGGIFRTAAEANTVKQATQIRDNERIDVMRDFLRDDVRKMTVLIKNNQDTEMVVMLAGDTGKVQWERFDAKDIEWEPDIDIEVDSFRELNQQEELAKWIQVFQISMQLIPLMPEAIQMDLIYFNLLKASKVANPEALVSNVKGSREYQLQEVMLMMLGQEIEVSPNEPHSEHIAAIDFLMNSEIAEVLQETPAWALMLEHRGQHEVMLQQLKEAAEGGQPSTLGQNPLDVTPNDAAQQERTESGILREAQRTGGRDQEEFV